MSMSQTGHQNTATAAVVQQQSSPQPNFAPKKCWICLGVVNLDESENAQLKRAFFQSTTSYVVGGQRLTTTQQQQDQQQGQIKLKAFTDRFVLAICKCRKKLAHMSCFNSYIDLKQSGNINIDIFCSQCNLKYSFYYPYNGKILRFFDFIDQFYNYGSSMMTGLIFFSSAYWCSLSYGAFTFIQIYGYHDAIKLLKNMNLFVLSVSLPAIPVLLVTSRFFSWQKAVVKLFPNYFKLPNENTARKLQQHRNGGGGGAQRNRQVTDEEVDKNDAKILYNIRLVVGGLMLPTIASSLDYMFLSRLGIFKSVLLRTTIAGLAYTIIKGVSKLVYKQKLIWQQTNRDIRDYDGGGTDKSPSSPATCHRLN